MSFLSSDAMVTEPPKRVVARKKANIHFFKTKRARMIFFLLLKRPQVGSQYPFDELDVKKKIDTRLSVKLH